jgi:hypothetical protein
MFCDIYIYCMHFCKERSSVLSVRSWSPVNTGIAGSNTVRSRVGSYFICVGSCLVLDGSLAQGVLLKA